MSRPTDLSAGELENLKKENLHPPTLKRQEGITLSQMRCWRLLDELQQWIEQLPQNHEGNKENYSAFFYNEIQTAFCVKTKCLHQEQNPNQQWLRLKQKTDQWFVLTQLEKKASDL